MKNISFCITSKNRLWQVRETLGQNLSHLEDDSEIVLVDYGSNDGLSEWIWTHFKAAIEQNKLRFVQVTSPVSWSCPIAKNVAHRMSTGDYLFGLDADNFMTADDLRHIRHAHQQQRPCHQFTGAWKDGSCGRIGLPRALFFQIGGYDEGLLPMGMQDMDLIKRMAVMGWPIVRLPAPAKPAIENSDQEKMHEVIRQGEDPSEAYRVMVRLNADLSAHRIAQQGPIRTGGYATLDGLLNGRPFRIDGLNRIYFGKG